MHSLRHSELVDQLFLVIDKILYLEKSQVFEIEEVRLYPSEIHLLLHLAKRPDANATLLAEHFGVTKGAISQTLARLEKKGVITKTRDSARKNELVLGLPALGERVMSHLRAMENAIRRRHDELFETLSEVERSTARKLLAGLLRSFGSL